MKHVALFFLQDCIFYFSLLFDCLYYSAFRQAAVAHLQYRRTKKKRLNAVVKMASKLRTKRHSLNSNLIHFVVKICCEADFLECTIDVAL